VVCNHNSPLSKVAEVSIVVEVGPEVVAGSSRMKAGTAQKMVLNMLSTGAMARLGYLYGNLMVNVHLKNRKLVQRGISILETAAAVDTARARRVLRAAGNRVPVALIMLQTDIPRRQAESCLRAAKGHVRKAIALALQNRTNGQRTK
jgi:N-acetylmuramic acid 6-phosphate etherase